MRNWVIAIAFVGVAVGAFLVGRASAKSEAREMVLQNIQMVTMQRALDAGGNVIRATTTLRLLERGDTAEAIGFNCRVADLGLRPLEFATREFPDGAENHARIARQATEVLGRMRKSGACPPPPRPTL